MRIRTLWPVLVLATALATGHLVATPSLWPVDETAHIAYARQLITSGQIPDIDDPLPMGADARDIPGLPERLRWERTQGRDGRQDIWVANHPPLSYAIQGLAYRIGGAIGGGTGSIAAARATSVVWLVIGVWATAQLALVLATAPAIGRRRRTPSDTLADPGRLLSDSQIALGAATLVAVTPTLSHLAGLTFNDVPAFATSTLCLYAGARIAVDGVTRRRLTVLGVQMGIALAVRTSSVAAAGIAGLLALYGWWRQPVRPRLLDLGAPMLWSAMALAPGFAWAARNTMQYGGPTASGYLLAKFERDINAGVLETFSSFDSWLRLGTRMFADLTTGHWNTGLRRDVIEMAMLIIVAAGAWWLVQTVRRRAAATTTTATQIVPLRNRVRTALRDRPGPVIWGLCSMVPVALAVAALQFHAVGGSLHGRYVLAGHAIMATAIMIWLAGMGRLTAVVLPVTLGLLLSVDLSLMWGVFLEDSSNWDRTSINITLPYLAGGLSRVILIGISLVVLAFFAVAITMLRPQKPGPIVLDHGEDDDFSHNHPRQPEETVAQPAEPEAVAGVSIAPRS